MAERSSTEVHRVANWGGIFSSGTVRDRFIWTIEPPSPLTHPFAPHPRFVACANPRGALKAPHAGGILLGMRVNLITQPAVPSTSYDRTIPLSLTIKPACGLPGDYEYETDSATLMRLLRKQTDLPASVLQRFEGNMWDSTGARLLGVELSDRLLTDIGYFID